MAEKTTALFCWSCFGLFQRVSVYYLSQNTIESGETSRLFHRLPAQQLGNGESGMGSTSVIP
jgi:hypothetical protein